MNKRRVRFLVTEKCNLKCKFCHKEGMEEGLEENLGVEDVKHIIDKYGDQLSGVVFSGGEPFIRKDLEEMVSITTKKLPTQIVTNGIIAGDRLENFEKYKKNLVLAVSIHSLDQNTYQDITRKDRLYKAKRTIEKAQMLGIEHRINVVPSHNLNTGEEEIKEFLEYARQTDSDLSFIEIQSIGAREKDQVKKLYEPIQEVEEIIKKEVSEQYQEIGWGIRLYKDQSGISVGIMKCPCASDICEKCFESRDITVLPTKEISPYFCNNAKIPFEDFEVLLNPNSFSNDHPQELVYQEVN